MKVESPKNKIPMGRRALWASLLLHAAVVCGLAAFSPWAPRVTPQTRPDDYVTQLNFLDLTPPESPREIPPDPPTPAPPEIQDEVAPPTPLHEVRVETLPEVFPEVQSVEAPAPAPSWGAVKLKFAQKAPALAAPLKVAESEPSGAPVFSVNSGEKALASSHGVGVGGSTGGGSDNLGTGSGGTGNANAGSGSKTGLGIAVNGAPAQPGNGTLSRKARLKEEIHPEYPELRRRENKTAIVKLQITVNPAGKAAEVTVLSEGVSPDFVDAAVSAARKARYEPALEDGRPIASNFNLLVRFVLR